MNKKRASAKSPTSKQPKSSNSKNYEQTRERLELEQLASQIRRENLGIEKIKYELAQAKEDLAKTTREQSIALAQDLEAKTIVFVGSVNQESVVEAGRDLRIMSRRFPGEPLTIVFNSPGGHVIDGLALFDQIIELRKLGHHVTTVARGQAASMGGILLQAGDLRKIGPNAHLLIHEVSANSFGTITAQEEQLEFSKRLQNRLLAILAERSSMSRAEIKTAWKKTDWWLDSRQAVKLGFADQVA
jgi:ATP-dependent protease ClpP protease subunit